MALVAVIAGGARHALIRLGGLLGLHGELAQGLLEGHPHGPGDLLFPWSEWGGLQHPLLSPLEGRECAHKLVKIQAGSLSEGQQLES